MQVHEVALKNLARERDSAISQLGVAYLSSQDLKSEIGELKTENIELKARLAKYSAISRHLLGNEQNEQTDADIAIELDMENHTDASRRPDSASHSNQKFIRKAAQVKPVREDTRTRISTQIDQEILKIDKQRQDEELFSLDLSGPMQNASKNAEAKASSMGSRKEPNTGKQRVRRVTVEDLDTTGPIDKDYDNIQEHTKEEGPTISQDLTFLSLMDVGGTRQIMRLV